MKRLKYQWATFDGLTKDLLYEIMKIRQEVFVVEQECAYLDADALDYEAYHLVGCTEASGDVVSYLRVLKPNKENTSPQIGRVLVKGSHRGKGLSKELMEEALIRVDTLFPSKSIKLSAQCYLQEFYEKLGFKTVSEPYDEDGIPHIGMLKGHGEDVLKEPIIKEDKGACLLPPELSLFARGMCSEEEKERYLKHIGECKECRDKYTTVMMFNVKEQSQADRGSVIYIFNTPIHLASLGVAVAFVGSVFGYLLYHYFN